MNLNMERNGRQLLSILSIVIACCLTSMSNAQQDAQVTTGLSQEQLVSAWKLQAENVSQELRLADNKRSQLVDIYVAARKRQLEEQKKIAAKQSSDTTPSKTSEEFDKEQRMTLSSELKAIITEEQLEKATQSFATFSSRWDKYVSAIAKFELEGEKRNEALSVVRNYIVEHAAAVREARSTGGKLSVSTSSELKSKLDKSLLKLLTAEQLADWQKASAFQKSGGGKKTK